MTRNSRTFAFRLSVVLLVAAFACAFGWFSRGWLAKDRCLDAGKTWDMRLDACIRVAELKAMPLDGRYYRPATFAAAKKTGLPLPVLLFQDHRYVPHPLGSIGPSLIIYDDGSVIRRKGEGFVTAKISPDDVESLVDTLAPSKLALLQGIYTATSASDQPLQELWLFRGNRPIVISVYGVLQDKEIQDQLPVEIVSAFSRLAQFAPHSERSWLPKTFELELRPFEHARESMSWPSSLPQPSASQMDRQPESSLTISVSAAHFEPVKRFLTEKPRDTAILIGTKKFSADLRLPFPQEGLWHFPNPEPDAAE